MAGFQSIIVCLFIVLLTPRLLTVEVEAASSPEPDVYVRITFNVAWARFCYLAPLFKHRLSDILIEEREGLVYLVPTSRIQIMDFGEECEQKHGNVKTAVVDFYISTRIGPNDVDKKNTELAFKILFHYWEAKRMVLLGPTFERMVEKVEISGKEAHAYPKKLNEGERIGIGIAVGLVVVFIVTVVYFVLYYRGKSNKSIKLKGIRRGVKRRESITSKGTEDIVLDDGMEGTSGVQFVEEDGEKAALSPKLDHGREEEEDDDDGEEEINIYVTKC